MKILLTAFEPFGGDTVNPAQEAVALAVDSITGVKPTVNVRVSGVSFEK